MGAAVSITRLDLTASELRKAASGERDGAAARRILSLALVLDGVDRKTAAETCGLDRQTLRDWVHRYNAAGLAGLRNLKTAARANGMEHSASQRHDRGTDRRCLFRRPSSPEGIRRRVRLIKHRR
jgi:winged helix-turn helix protein